MMIVFISPEDVAAVADVVGMVLLRSDVHGQAIRRDTFLFGK